MLHVEMQYSFCMYVKLGINDGGKRRGSCET